MTKKTPERIAAVITGLSCGIPLTVICRKDGMPDPETVRNWMNADPELALAIAGARETGFDVIAMDVLDIVDNVKEDPASRRIRADARLKLLAKWDPKRYGERTQTAITGADGGPVRSEVAMASPETMAELTLALLSAANVRGIKSG